MKHIFLKILLSIYILFSFGINAFSKAFPHNGDLTFGINGAGNNWDSFADFILPLASKDTSFIFLNPRLSMTGDKIFGSSSNEMNIGIGFRQYVNNMIFGINAYYDSRKTELGNNFEQTGFGLEFMSKHLDIRANYYMPFKDTNYLLDKIYDIARGHHISATHYYEVATQGFDGEIGFKIPLPDILGELRLYGGYYYFSTGSNYGDETFNGLKAKIEYRPLSIISLNYAVYENEDFNGSKWQAGLKFNLPLDFRKALRAKNPFFGMKIQDKSVKKRMGEMVERDMHIRTFNVGKKMYDDKLLNENGDIYYFTVLSPSGSGDGTFENPASLDQGVILNKTVTGSNAAMLLLPGTYLKDSEIEIAGHNADRVELVSYKYLSKTYNVFLKGYNALEESSINYTADVNAVSLSSLVTQNEVIISGLNFTGLNANTKTGIYIDSVIYSADISILENKIDGFNKGLSINSSSATIKVMENLIFNNNTGIEIVNSNPLIYLNEISSSSYRAINISLSNGAEIIYNSIYDSTSPIHIESSENSLIYSNDIYLNYNDAIYVNASKNLQFSNNQIYLNTGNALYLVNCDTITVEQNMIFENLKSGIYADDIRNSVIYLNTISENTNDGITLTNSNNTLINYNSIDNNLLNGIKETSSELSHISDNFITGNQNNGIYLLKTKAVTATNNQINDNAENGLHVEKSSNVNTNVNTISNNKTGIYAYDVTGLTASLNDINNNLAEGIFASLVSNSNMEQNSIYLNVSSGVAIVNSSQNIDLLENSISNNLNGGIFAENSSFILIEDNFIEYNQGSNGGILTSGITALIITRNNLKDNSNSEIKVSGSDSVSITENNIDVDGKSHGIYIDNGTNTELSKNVLGAFSVNQSFFALYLTGTTSFNVISSGNNKFFDFQGLIYSGDTNPVQNYLNDVFPFDEVIQ